MVTKPTLRQQLQYYFDNYMARGTIALIGGLALLSLVVIVIAAVIISLGGLALAPEGSVAPMSFSEAAWESLMRTFDAGTMGGDAGWGFRVVMLFVTVGGIFVVSALIGVLTAGVEGKLEELRKGRSHVLENEHTVIFGWSPQIFTIISELVFANESRKKGAIVVVLAEQDKVEMEGEIRNRIPEVKNTRVICRSGRPMDLTDLELASPHTARSIIILPPEGDDPDAFVIKTVLAITNNPNRHAAPYNIVTQIREARNMEVVRMIGQKDHVNAVLVGDLIARVTAQTSRQSGLSVVYTELLNFGGDEIYIKSEPTLEGKTFGESLSAYETSTLIGLQFADGRSQLNPPMEKKIGAEDKIIAISADDDTITPSGIDHPLADINAICEYGKPRPAVSEKCLILGWNRCAEIIIRQLDNYVAKGSRVTVIADGQLSSEAGEKIKFCCGTLPNQKVVFQVGDTTDRNLLERVKAVDYDHVIVLSYAGLEAQAADAKTLVTLLHLRNIAERDETPFSMVSEMLDLRNRELAEAAHVDDFIISDHLISLMLSQLSENGDLNAVFQDLFDPEGSEIYLKPVSDYVNTSQQLSFHTLVEAARRRGETAIGYRLLREASQPPSYGVHTNPKKSEPVVFVEGDKIIVLAES